MKQPYTHRYFPPAPVAEVEVIHVASRHSTGPISALVDTGTDVTVVPLAVLEQVQATFVRNAFARAHWGDRLAVALYAIDLRIDSSVIPGVEVIGDKWKAEIILGRDILNKLWLELDGPAQMVEVADKRPRRK